MNRLLGGPDAERSQLHDMWRLFASRAVALGESLPMIGKLLGHTQVQITARYAHLARDTVKASTSRVGDSIGEALASPEQLPGDAQPSTVSRVGSLHPPAGSG